jgi:4-diphosphocytidyl-2-C-methyl-D-erythritol kinase
MQRIRIIAPAKVNLYLEVIDRRPDGYHDLRTIFQAIDIYDTLEFDEQPFGLQVTSDWPGLPEGKDNLCWRAAALLSSRRDLKKGMKIHVSKQIPPGAGLGGGSSDAAATLKGLNRIWRLNLDRGELQEMASLLGADVAFFLDGGAGVGEGMGEKIRPIPTSEISFVIVWPEICLSTPAVYGEWDKRPEKAKSTLASMITALEDGEQNRIASLLRNNLEGAANRLSPICGEIKEEMLRAGCLGAMVSGSGSAVFGIASSNKEAQKIAKVLHGKYHWVRSAKSLARKSGTENG